jgi:hypothetical protein
MITAEAKYDALKEALDTMLAAGVSWSTAFPYKRYNVDAVLEGKHSTSYSMDHYASKVKSSLYLVRTDIFETGSASADLDTCLESMHTVTERLDASLHATKTKSAHVDACIEEIHDESYSIDGILKLVKSKPYTMDCIGEKDMVRTYRLDSFAENRRRSSYLVTVVIAS